MNTRVEGCDVSSWNLQMDWSKTSKLLDFTFIRAIYNQTIDKEFERNWSETQKYGMPRGMYAYLLWGVDPLAQANALIAEVNKLGDPTQVWGDLPPVADAEDTASTNAIVTFLSNLTYGYKKESGERVASKVPANRVTNSIINAGMMNQMGAAASTPASKLQIWLNKIEQASGKVPIIYTSYGWWSQYIGNLPQFKKYKLWIAHYNRQAPLVPYPWQPGGQAYWQTGSSPYNGPYYGAPANAPYIDLDIGWFNKSWS